MEQISGMLSMSALKVFYAIDLTLNRFAELRSDS